MPGAAIFTRVPDAAKRLTPLQRDVLIALLGFCRFAPFCWPGQRRLAREIGRSLTRVNAGIGELVDLGAIRKRMQPGRQTCIYEIGAEFWIPRKRANASNPAGYSLGTCSARGTESDSTFKKKTPRSPPLDAGGAAPVFSNSEEQEEPGIEAAAPPPLYGPGPQSCAGQAAAPPPVCRTVRQSPEAGHQAGARPYRNRQRRPGDPPKPRRKRQRQRLTEDLQILDFLIARRTGQPRPQALPRPAVEILEPVKSPAGGVAGNYPSYSLTSALEVLDVVIAARLARRAQADRSADLDLDGELLDARRIA
jgi:hypothetical protein